MIKTKAIRKIFITTVTMFILLTAFSISFMDNKEALLRVNVEVNDKIQETNDIYLLNKNNYLVKYEIMLDGDSTKDKVLKVLNYLMDIDNSIFSNELSGTIPKGVKILDVICGNQLVTVNFSKKLLDVSSYKEKQMISSIVYSLTDIDDIEGISILVEGKKLDSYPNSKESLPNILNRDIGINKEYKINSRDNISSVVIYYMENIDDELYYVPVTKYINDDRDKIKIVVEELTTSYIYEENLMSFLNSKVKLIDYKEENDTLILNFNEYLFDSKDKVLEEVIYCLGYSVFDNYDVSMVMFEVNGQEVGYIDRK